MFINKLYKSANLHIEPSNEIISETIDKIRNGQMNVKKHFNRVCYNMLISTVCAALFIVIIYNFLGLPFMKNNKIVIQNIASNTINNNSSTSIPNNQIDKQNVIHINKFEKFNIKSSANFGLFVNRQETWSIQRYIEFLDLDPRPSYIPKTLTFIGQTSRKMSFNDNCKDEPFVPYYNTWKFEYTEDSKDENSKRVCIYTSKGFIDYFSAPMPNIKLPDNPSPDDFRPHGDISKINGTNVELWYKGSGYGRDTNWLQNPYLFNNYYCAYFMHEGIGFIVTAENGITENELIEIIQSIIK